MDLASILQIAPAKLIPGLLSQDETDVSTEKKFSTDEQSAILQKLDKYRKK